MCACTERGGGNSDVPLGHLHEPALAGAVAAQCLVTGLNSAYGVDLGVAAKQGVDGKCAACEAIDSSKYYCHHIHGRPGWRGRYEY